MFGVGVVAHEVVGATLDPAGIAVLDQRCHLRTLQGQCADEVPAGECEHAWLPSVVLAEQKVGVADLAGDGVGDVVEIRDADRRGDDGRGRAGDAVRREEGVVGAGVGGERLAHGLADVFGELMAVVDLSAELVLIVAMHRREVHEFVGELVVVLHRVDQGGVVDPDVHGLVEDESQEFGVLGGESELGGRAGDEVVGQIGADGARLLDVVHRQVELLEREAADLADQRADQLVRRLRQGVAFRPGRGIVAAFDAEEPVRVEAEAARTQIGE